MSAFRYTVGDTVRLPTWPEGECVTITAVGLSNFLAVDEYGDGEMDYPQDATWFRYGAVAA